MGRERRASIIGLGLIGGSLALALHRRGWRVTGCDRAPAARRSALRLGAVDRITASPGQAARGVGMIVIATPVGAMRSVLREVGRHAAAGAVVTDTGSVKGPVLTAARSALPRGVRFVGGHPMAGSERSGMAAARPDLFRGRPCAIVGDRETDPAAVRAVMRLWRDAGARPVRVAAAAHDRVVARVSHLPHLLAFALAGFARDPLARRLAAGSFHDATRVARSDAALWAGILAANRREVSGALVACLRSSRRLLAGAARGSGSLRSAAGALRRA